MRPKDRRLRNIMPVVPLDMPEAKKSVDTEKDNSIKNDSHKVKLGPGSKR